MARYEVFVFCNECSDVHPMAIRLTLDDGPAADQSIGDTYAGKEMPPNVATLERLQFQCPNTSSWFEQKDNKQIFLVPAS
jgi:hypothetical protein